MSDSTFCPRCFREVLLPLTASPVAWVRCPLCRSTYRLQDARDYTPPELELVDPPAGVEADAALGASLAGAASSSAIEAAHAAPSWTKPAEEARTFGFADTQHHGSDSSFTLEDSGDHTAVAVEDQDTEPTIDLSDESQLSEETPVAISENDDDAFALAPVEGDRSGAVEANRIATAGGSSLTTPARKKKPKKSAVAEIVKVVLGGVGGLAIGYLGLLWIRQQDPLPPLAQSLPEFIVPASVRKPSTPEASNGRAVAQNSRPQNPRSAPIAGTGTQDELDGESNFSFPTATQTGGGSVDSLTQEDIGEPGSPAAEPATPEDEAMPLEPDFDPLAPGIGEIEFDPTVGLPSDNGVDPIQPSAGESTATMPEDSNIANIPGVEFPDELIGEEEMLTEPAEDLSVVPEAPESESAVPGLEEAVETTPDASGAEAPVDETAPEISVSDAPAISPGEAQTSLAAVAGTQATLIAAKTQDDARQAKSARVAMYRDYARLAQAMTYATDVGEQDAAETDTLLQAIASDEEEFEEVGKLASFWMTFEKRPINGILLAGTVADIQELGPLYQVKMQLPGMTEVTVLSRQQPPVETGAKAIVLGSILANPAERLEGLPADADLSGIQQAVWSGHWANVGNEAQASSEDAAQPAEDVEQEVTEEATAEPDVESAEPAVDGATEE